MPMDSARARAVPAAFPFPRVLEALAGCGAATILLGGSHATGEAVWAVLDGRRVSLSDLDLHLVYPDEPARARAAAEEAALTARLLALGREEGLAAPVETAYLTAAALAALPARPGTIELRRHGVALHGDEAAPARIAAHQPRDVSEEERMLLVENRAFELLLAHPAHPRRGTLDRLKARHGIHKTALDLALAAALAAGEQPDGARARVAWVKTRPGAAHEGLRRSLERVWEEALEWRERGAAPGFADRDGAWTAVASAWAGEWLRRGGVGDGVRGHEVWRAARRLARRAPLARRLRGALGGPGAAPLPRALAGTRQHRLNAAAGVLVIAALRSPDPESLPALDATAGTALRDLGAPAAADWTQAALALAREWDRAVLGGRRFGVS